MRTTASSSAQYRRGVSTASPAWWRMPSRVRPGGALPITGGAASRLATTGGAGAGAGASSASSASKASAYKQSNGYNALNDLYINSVLGLRVHNPSIVRHQQQCQSFQLLSTLRQPRKPPPEDVLYRRNRLINMCINSDLITCARSLGQWQAPATMSIFQTTVETSSVSA